MALDRHRLEADLVAMMDAALADAEWTKQQTAAAMAAAIDRYVRGGIVTGVRVAHSGLTLTQTGQVSLQ